jgi:hypothetical protein
MRESSITSYDSSGEYVLIAFLPAYNLNTSGNRATSRFHLFGADHPCRRGEKVRSDRVRPKPPLSAVANSSMNCGDHGSVSSFDEVRSEWQV